MIKILVELHRRNGRIYKIYIYVRNACINIVNN